MSVCATQTATSLIPYSHKFDDTSLLFLVFSLLMLFVPPKYLSGSNPNLDPPRTGYTNPNLFDIARPTSSVLYKLLYQTTIYFFDNTLSSHTLRFPLEPPNPVEVSLFLTGTSICRYRIAKPRSVITFHHNFIKEHTLCRVRNHDNRHTIWSLRWELNPLPSGYEPAMQTTYTSQQC